MRKSKRKIKNQLKEEKTQSKLFDDDNDNNVVQSKRKTEIRKSQISCHQKNPKKTKELKSMEWTKRSIYSENVNLAINDFETLTLNFFVSF